MDYQLMHKQVPVLSFSLDSETSAILRIGKIERPEHVPVGIPVRKGVVDRAALNAWWQGRAIPASRQGIHRALEEMSVPSTHALLEKCMGLSLSDQYWVRPADADLQWSQINFFEHPFSEDVGDILFGGASSGDPINLMSPNNTSDGWLKKKWAIIDGKRCLVKGGSGATQQEPYNEVFASLLMERLGVPHASYRLMMQEDFPYSVCEDFITTDTELISAWYVMQTQKKENHVSIYQHYLNCCEALGIAGVRDALDRMLVVDYLLVNEDRHQNNFGVIRNANTLVWEGAAPIYDSGTSLWFDTPTPMIRAEAPRVTSKPFKTSHEEQIKLVSSFDWIDWDALTDLDELFQSVTEGSMFVDDARRTAIGAALRKRVQMLKEHTAAGKAFTQGADISGDVQTDVAYSGKTE